MPKILKSSVEKNASPKPKVVPSEKVDMAEDRFIQEQEAFEFIFPKWEEADGVLDIEGFSIMLHNRDLSKRKTVISSGTEFTFPNIKDFHRAVGYLASQKVLTNVEKLGSRYKCEWGSADSVIAMLEKHMDDERLEAFCKVYETFEIPESIMAKRGWNGRMRN